MTDRLIAQRVLVRDMPDRSRIVATLRIDQIGGNPHPHFSATCAIYEAHGTWSGAACQRNGREWDGGGADHESILRAFPGAAPFVAMHLSDYPSGRPMHAEANARYFWSGESEAYELEQYGPAYVDRVGTGRERAAQLLRCAPDDLPSESEASPDDFAAFVAAQAPRWELEAREARDLLERMPDCTDLRGYDMHGKAIDRVPLPGWLVKRERPVPVDV